MTAPGCSFAFSFSFSLSCSFTLSLSFSFSALATSLSGRIRSAMEAFLGRPSWLVSDFRPRLFLSVKKSPSFLLRVLAGGGQGAELAGATSCTVIDSSSCFFSVSVGSTLLVKNSSTPSSTRPMSSRTSFSLSIIVSCGLLGR